MDIAERLEQILGDENALSQIQQMATALRGDSPTEGNGDQPTAEGGGGLNANMLGSLMGMLGGGNSPAGGTTTGGGDSSVALIRSLKPFLSQKRKKRAGEAVKIMKMIELLPVLQKSGIFENLMGGSEDE